LWLAAPGSGRRTGLTLRELLPDGRQGSVIGLLLAAFYAVTGFLIRPGSMPTTIVPHLSVLALYALFCGLAAGVLARSACRDRPVLPARAAPGRGRLAAASAVFVVSLAAVSAALSPSKAAAGGFAMAAGLIGMAAGLAITVAAIVAAIRRA